MFTTEKDTGEEPSDLSGNYRGRVLADFKGFVF